MTARRALPILVLALAALASDPGRSATRPTLLVIVVVDGLSWDRLDAWRPAWKEGFAELLAQGHVAAQTNYAHLNTETCPGHASISTGAPPRVTGIVGNEWYAQGKRVSCVGDSSPGNLMVDGLGDVLGPGARVVSLSAKNRAAVMLAGRGRRHAAFWFHRQDGRFVTSDAYDRAAPTVAAVQSIVDRIGPHAEKPLWERLSPAPAVPVVPARKLAMRQFPEVGLGFPHDPGRHSGRLFDGLYYSPFIDTFVADLALEVLDDPALALGRSGGTDLLALSFSAPDNVAHYYGDGSEEHLDTLRRLDHHLGRLLAELRARPQGSVVLALSADHGFLPADAPFEQRLETEPGGSAIAALNAVLRAGRGLPRTATPVIGMTCWHLYVDAAANEPAKGAVPAAFQSLWPGAIEAVVDPRASPPAGFRKFVENSLYSGRSGDLLLFPKAGLLSHWDPVRAWGHGSHHPYDTHVPLLLWGAGIQPGCSSSPTTPYDLAPTLADLAGVRLPRATGHSLRAQIAKSAGRACAAAP